MSRPGIAAQVRGHAFRAEVILVPVRHQDCRHVVVRRLRVFEPAALLGRRCGVGRDAVADGRVDEELASVDRQQHAGIGDVLQLDRPGTRSGRSCPGGQEQV